MTPSIKVTGIQEEGGWGRELGLGVELHTQIRLIYFPAASVRV